MMLESQGLSPYPRSAHWAQQCNQVLWYNCGKLKEMEV